MSVIDNKALNRFELEENGHLALATYRRHEHSISIPHVEADPALRGTGAAGRLMEGIIEMARRERFFITPTCPFAKDWFSKHPEASDVLG